jgi:hypothetical protein
MTKRSRGARLLLLIPLGMTTAAVPTLTACDDTSGPTRCCIVCVQGTKPCGDTCIARNVPCLLGRGCACS